MNTGKKDKKKRKKRKKKKKYEDSSHYADDNPEEPQSTQKNSTKLGPEGEGLRDAPPSLKEFTLGPMHYVEQVDIYQVYRIQHGCGVHEERTYENL